MRENNLLSHVKNVFNNRDIQFVDIIFIKCNVLAIDVYFTHDNEVKLIDIEYNEYIPLGTPDTLFIRNCDDNYLVSYDVTDNLIGNIKSKINVVYKNILFDLNSVFLVTFYNGKYHTLSEDLHIFSHCYEMDYTKDNRLYTIKFKFNRKNIMKNILYQHIKDTIPIWAKFLSFTIRIDKNDEKKIFIIVYYLNMAESIASFHLSIDRFNGDIRKFIENNVGYNQISKDMEICDIILEPKPGINKKLITEFGVRYTLICTGVKTMLIMSKKDNKIIEVVSECFNYEIDYTEDNINIINEL